MAKGNKPDVNTGREIISQDLDSIFHTSPVYEDFPSEPQGKRLGRKVFPDDATLDGQRDSLVDVMEACWPEVGLLFMRARTSDHVRAAFELLRDAGYAVRLAGDFFYKFELRANPKEIRKARKEAGVLYVRRRELVERYDKLIAEVREAGRAFPKANAGQIEIIKRHLGQKWKALYETIQVLERTVKEVCELDAKIETQRAFYCRQEILNFIRKHRYPLNPRNLAMAAAGLPHISWRQSFLRCAKMPCGIAAHVNYQVFEVVREILKCKSNVNQSVLELVRNQLPTIGNKYARKYLIDNWASLKRAVQEVDTTKRSPVERPFAITSAFVTDVRRTKTDVERIVDSQEVFPK